MPFDGNGVYTPVSNSFSVPVADTTIDETDAAALWADLATALTLCVTNDGQTSTPTINDPIINEIRDSGGTNEMMEFGTTGSATVNFKIANAATGNPPTLSTSGEADIGMDFENSEGEELLKLGATASAVNEITITNSATGDAVTASATGDDTNIDIELTPKGAGVVNVGGVEVVTTTGTQTLTNKTLTSPIFNTGVSGTALETTITDIDTKVPTSGAVFDKVAGLNVKILDIGDWNMDTTSTVNVAHGITLSKIRSLSMIIRDDADSAYYDPPTRSGSDIYWAANATNIVLTRITGHPIFDNASYNSTSFNRGWIVIQYTD